VPLAMGVLASVACAQEPVPAGGTSLLPDDALTVFGTWGKTEMGQTESIAVTGQPFSRACRLTTLKTPPNQWELQYGTWIQKSIKKGSVLLIRFYLRSITGQAETGECKTKIGIGTGGPEWASSMTEAIGIPTTWNQFNFPFVARYDTPVNGAIMAFDMGFSPQTFEIGGIQLIDYGSTKTVADLPRTRSDYVGQEDDAPWRKAAQARIEKLRKSDLRLAVVDAAGKPIPRANVAVRMRRHAFAFGSAVAADTLVAEGSDSDHYRRIVLDNYTAAPIENHLKWPFWEGAWTKPADSLAVDWLHGYGIGMPISGPLVWGGWSNLPDDLKAKRDDRDYLLKRIDDNIIAEMGRFTGGSANGK